jgi:pyridoxine 5-phosphate synthase
VQRREELMSHVKLGVNVDHVATLRQVRRALYPDPVIAAGIVEMAGADQITIHLREDRRHIQDRDLQILRETARTRLNLEMAGSNEMVQVAFSAKPDQATLVPERRQELTTEGGLDVVSGRDNIRKVVRSLHEGGIDVSLFIDPDLDQIRAAHRTDATMIELHTGKYCDATTERERAHELSRIADAARAGVKLGLRVAAGHGLNYENVRPIVALEEITELNIGHSIIARAVLVGLDRAVRDMIELLKR